MAAARTHHRRAHAALLAAAIMLAADIASAGATFDAVKARGHVICGVHTGRIGFATKDATGSWSGFDVDMCRIVAAAVFGNAGKVRYVPTKTQVRLFALQSNTVDMLARNTTWTLVRDTTFHLDFAAINFLDQQGFLVRKALGAKSLKDLAGRTVCVETPTTSELRLADIVARGEIALTPRTYEDYASQLRDYADGRCDAITSDVTALTALRASDLADPDEHEILPEAVGLEPLALVVREDDTAWTQVVRWSFFATLAGEALGVTSSNVESMLTSTDPKVKRLLGVVPGNGKALGLDERWAYHILKQVGTYAEIFERNLGQGSPLKLRRGPNALWIHGGVLYPPPLL
jgi:general L-amino acid transport system substrate-binding protein